MYYKTRAQAGRILAKKLANYAVQDAVVVALSQGSVILGAQIAMRLHTNLLLYLIKNIYLPGEVEAIAGLGSPGTFSFNNAISAGELEDLRSEFHQYIDQKRFEAFHELNTLLGREGEIKKDMLRHHVVILVSDGFSSAMSLDMAHEFFKTVAIKKLIVATPISSVAAVDRMHLVADEIICLSVVENLISVNHYYEDNTLPTLDDALKIMRNISINWSRPG